MKQTRPTEKTSGRPTNFAEYIIEQGLFQIRWFLAPIYVGLALSLVLILIKFGQESWEMARHALSISGENTILGVLSLIDLSLMANLLLMMIFGGYQNFVSKLELGGHEDTPEWIGHVGFSDLKLKLMASIVAISAIEVLKAFMTIGSASNRELIWGIAIHMTFVVSAVLLALMDLITARARKYSETQ
ncbi:TIGR00645 family protein (plasmid) [Paraburkholderia sp. PREW-6R]|uniref:TIGR00645 family protein n=1 Tax=Paraburkholderia sp. PREW-6R TaxID=3141544 RepID=UPI0031F51A61